MECGETHICGVISNSGVLTMQSTTSLIHCYFSRCFLFFVWVVAFCFFNIIVLYVAVYRMFGPSKTHSQTVYSQKVFQMLYAKGIVSPTISFAYLRLSTIMHMYSGSTSGDTTCRCGKGGHISKVTTPSALPKLLCIQVWKTPGRYGTT